MIIGTTGPTIFNTEVQSMIESYYKAMPLYITQNSEKDLLWVVENIDALILAGGSDINPMTYGTPITRGDNLSKFDTKRDKRELFLIDACIAAKKPILAICRGMQIVCVKFGFPIWADISGAEIAHSPGDIKLKIEDGDTLHFVECLEGFQDKYFNEPKGVLSYHHQAIPYFPRFEEHNGINVVATADTEREAKKNHPIVEIIESNEMQIVGFQGHPEVDYMYGNVVSNKILEKFKSFLE